MTLSELKVCTSCDEDDPEMFGKEKKGKFGLRAKCKKCRSIDRKDSYSKNKDKESDYGKKYRLENQEKVKASRKIQNAKESTKESKRLWARDNKEKIDAKNLRYRKCNPDKIKESNKVWREANPGKVNFYAANYRSNKKQATPVWQTEKDKSYICEIYRISSELSRITGTQYEVDHIIPLAGVNVSGLHVPSNLQILNMSENRQKSNKVV